MSPKSKRRRQYLPFFVYGTLLPGQPNSHLWQSEITASQPATFDGGRLHDMGSYPMLVEVDHGLVHGRLIQLRTASYEHILKAVDALEGFDEAQPTASAYQRAVRPVKLERGDQVAAWVYLGQKRYVTDAPIIEHGNWVQYAATRLDQIEQWWVDVSTVLGLHESS